LTVYASGSGIAPTPFAMNSNTDTQNVLEGTALI
jgi:hypothetical protein